jgi:hypothetical protein
VHEQEKAEAAATHLLQKTLRLLCGNREDGPVRAAVVDIHVTRSTVENARLRQAITDALYISRFRSDDDALFLFLVEPEARNVFLGAEEDRGLGGGRCAGQAGGKRPDLPVVALEKSLQVGSVAVRDRVLKVVKGECVDLQRNETALLALAALASFSGEREILEAIVCAVERVADPLPPAG